MAGLTPDYLEFSRGIAFASGVAKNHYATLQKTECEHPIGFSKRYCVFRKLIVG